MLTVKIKYLRDIEPIANLFVGDWIDLRCGISLLIKPFEYLKIPLGVAMELPEGYSAIVAPRSSLFKNHGILCANSLGIIDNSYKGDNDEWNFLGYSTRHTYIPINERICQFRLIEKGDEILFKEVQKLGNPDRGGIGSTGGM